MFYKFTINLKKIQNDVILPKSIEKSVLYYEIVVKNNDVTILRIPFKNEEKWKLELYDMDDTINNNRITLSMLPHVVRFNSKYDTTFHACKIVHDIDDEEGPIIKRIGYETHIKEGTSDDQDISFFTLSNSIPHFIEDFKSFGVEKISLIDELPLHEHSFNTQYWLTQREFYSTTHVTLSNNVHRENIQLISDFLDKYKRYSFKNTLELLILLSNSLTNNRIKYKIDCKFAQYAVTSDAGNIEIETSSRGDCEDFAHFYMRIFRTLCGTYKYFIKNMDSNIYNKCNDLATNYIPFNFICQVKLSRGLEFHSTMIIIPITKKLSTISFEVTNPKKSYILPSKEYNEWHNNGYFLVDNYFISRVNDISLDDICIGDLTFINY